VVSRQSPPAVAGWVYKRMVGRAPCLALALTLALTLVAFSVPAAGRIVVPAEPVPDDVHPVLAQIGAAFEAGDHETLATLMHPDGVNIGLAPQEDRSRLMTPAQTHYYFKNLFQQRRTMRFEFVKHQLAGGERLHAVAAWRWERTDNGRLGSQRLMLTLARAAGRWRVTELTSLRGG